MLNGIPFNQLLCVKNKQMKYSSGFIGDFKLGDNIVHNLAILRELYATQSSGPATTANLLRKPIIVWIGTIAEAILYDLYVVKISKFTSEGVPNIPSDVLEEIRDKTIDEFAKYIDNARSKKLVGEEPQIYNNLDELRRLRNRVHIQNTKGHFERDDGNTFTDARQRAAERTLEELISVMVARYLRSNSKHCVEELQLPWEGKGVRMNCSNDGGIDTHPDTLSAPTVMPRKLK